MNSNLLTVLQRARARISVPGQWTRGAFALNAAGSAAGVRSWSPEATRWCAVGAVDAEVYALGLPDADAADLYVAALRALRGGLPNGFLMAIADFNDMHETVEPVLAVFDRAVARLVSP
jgi:hypothetical protein